MNYLEIYKEIEKLDEIAYSRGWELYKLSDIRNGKNETIGHIEFNNKGILLSIYSTYSYEHQGDYTIPIEYIEMSNEEWKLFIDSKLIEREKELNKKIKTEERKTKASKLAQFKALKKELNK